MNSPQRGLTRVETLCAGLALALVLIWLAGCSGKTQLMPTPTLYTWQNFDPFKDVPPELQTSYVDVLYLTDRAMDNKPGEKLVYGYKRSRSVTFGVSRVEFGKDVSWDELVKASRTEKRSVNLELSEPETNEIVRFPQTPRKLIRQIQSASLSPPTTAPATEPAAPATNRDRLLGDDEDAEQLAAEEVFNKELSARLAKTPTKNVYMFIHGYNNTFQDSVETIAQLWHFFGRQGVPVAYSWPAGSPSLLRGYTYDSASSEFTVYHLKQMLRLIAKNPDVQKLHIICHSRGTDATVNALRELHMEIHGSGRSTRQELKLGTVVLAAPDIDVDIVIQKLTTVRLGQVPERFAMYVCSKDQALGISSWLYGGLMRLGELKADIFSPEELEALRSSKTVQIVDARVSNTGAFGHDYFHSNPAVSSDLVLLMRYQLPPGAEYGRPLDISQHGFWQIDDKYPGAPRDMTTLTSGK